MCQTSSAAWSIALVVPFVIACGSDPVSTRAGGGASAGGSSSAGTASSAGSSTAGGVATGGSAGSGAPGGSGGATNGACAGADEFADPVSSRCYLRQSQTMSWQEAEASCVTWGGHLAGIATTSENSVVVAALRQAGVEELVWVGANDLMTEGAWGFSNGEPYTYTVGQAPWDEGKPNDAMAAEDCACVDTSSDQGLWNDVSCDDTLPSVCEK